MIIQSQISLINLTRTASAHTRRRHSCHTLYDYSCEKLNRPSEPPRLRCAETDYQLLFEREIIGYFIGISHEAGTYQLLVSSEKNKYKKITNCLLY